MSEIDPTSGNAILVCVKCKGRTDKGCPPLEGQSDHGFICPKCQGEIDLAALKIAATEALPSVVVMGR